MVESAVFDRLRRLVSVNYLSVGKHRLPIYAHSGEPDLEEYLNANAANKVKLEHLFRPSVDRGLNPYHYVLVRVDREKLKLQVISVDWELEALPKRR